MAKILQSKITFYWMIRRRIICLDSKYIKKNTLINKAIISYLPYDDPSNILSFIITSNKHINNIIW
jgi:hypothetical protein